MPEQYEDAAREAHLARTLDAQERGGSEPVRAVLCGMHPADVALLLESLPAGERDLIREHGTFTGLLPMFFT